MFRIAGFDGLQNVGLLSCLKFGSFYSRKTESNKSVFWNLPNIDKIFVIFDKITGFQRNLSWRNSGVFLDGMTEIRNKLTKRRNRRSLKPPTGFFSFLFLLPGRWIFVLSFLNTSFIYNLYVCDLEQKEYTSNHELWHFLSFMDFLLMLRKLSIWVRKLTLEFGWHVLEDEIVRKMK